MTATYRRDIVLALSLIIGACGGAGDPGSAGPAGANGAAGADGAVGAAGPIGQTGQTGQTGAGGETGPTGPSGAAAAYGDGSAGDLLVNSDTDWTDDANLPSNANFQFKDVAISAELKVPSGTVLRATGSVTISGALVVDAGALGGVNRDNGGGFGPGHPAGEGMAHAAAGNAVPTTDYAPGAFGGRGLSAAEASLLLLPTTGGGGGGAGLGTGQSAGGALTIIAKGAIHVTGEIHADHGDDTSGYGAGGGSGGIVVLASSTEIAGNGQLTARGGDGGAGGDTIWNQAVGAGGGGSGGIVRLIAPSIAFDVSHGDVSGGLAGNKPPADVQTTRPTIAGGGGGGALVGRGGSGGVVWKGASPTFNNASNGDDGVVIASVFDPASLY